MKLRYLLEAWQHDELGIPPDADAATIKKAYHKAAVQLHPDKPTGDEQKFRDAKRAYEELTGTSPRTAHKTDPERATRGRPSGGSSGGGRNRYQSSSPFEDFFNWAQEWADRTRRAADAYEESTRRREEAQAAFHGIMQEAARMVQGELPLKFEVSAPDAWPNCTIRTDLSLLENIGINTTKDPWSPAIARISLDVDNRIKLQYNDWEQEFRADFNPESIADLLRSEHERMKWKSMLASFMALSMVKSTATLAILAKHNGYRVTGVHGMFEPTRTEDDWDAIGSHHQTSIPKTWLVIGGMEVGFEDYGLYFPGELPAYTKLEEFELDWDNLERSFMAKKTRYRNYM